METISQAQARRLALVKAGLMKPGLTGFPKTAAGRGRHARAAALLIIETLGYLQLDTVAVAGARSHAIVLMSRLDGFSPDIAESLLKPGQPVFEYWGHEASWMPMALYPVFAFRRKAYRRHPWWGDLIGQHPRIATLLMDTIRNEGPMRSSQITGPPNRGWWDLSIAKRVASALWSCGRLAIRERNHFQRTYDLIERVIPEPFLDETMPEAQALEQLLLLAFKSHGWATEQTLSQTWRLGAHRVQLRKALERLFEQGLITPCRLITPTGGHAGWIGWRDLDLSQRLSCLRPRKDKGVLISPFDPLIWDRNRVRLLFDFDQVLEIYKPAHKRKYGYYCLPVLAGEQLAARLDLKADKRAKTLAVLSRHDEHDKSDNHRSTRDAAVQCALKRHADALGLTIRP